MKKFTSLIGGMLLVCILLMTSCTFEGSSINGNVEPSAEARSWFNNHESEYNASILQYIDNLQWENAIVSNGKDGEVIEVPFTLKENLSTSNENGTLNNVHHRLVFIKNDPNNFKTYYVQIFAANENPDSLDKTSTFNGVANNFNGKIFTQDLLTKNATAIEYKNGKNVRLATTSKMREEFYDCTFIGYWSEGGTFTPIKLLYCSGGSDAPPSGGPTTGGGVAGGSTPSTPTVDDDTPPSCESFNFTSKVGANWQESLVKNVYFRVILLDNKGLTINHVVSYPQPILFGMPINLNKGNGDISGGAAATVSAMVLDKVMGEIVKKYGRTNVSDLTLRLEFQQLLISEYRTYTNGGTVNFNSASPLPATNYKTNASATGLCD
ncbi:hypothetical protein [Flavobacterium sharifuzzamanii]|uniref:hypothetical protein n=1 Tax=Flavobacterium sharifuzzamanii TaxID=2211133 RepID=UPI0013002A8E|nr:hypothetical protein [Flavobacterium sharifuzzamanii]KAF2081740.1 hypothetical protein DMA14_08050 [Flavobacterium sharifuzzamanii]